MSDDKQKILHSALAKLLTPLVRLMLRNGVTHGVFEEIARKIYVDVAEKDFSLDDKKQTTTRISTITGLNRKEVARLQQMDASNADYSLKEQHRVARVIFGWINNPSYLQLDGDPKPLSFDKDELNFSTLVKQYSGDMTPRAIFDELNAKGVIQIDDDGLIHLLQRAYIPTTSEVDKLKILGVDVNGLISTIDRNIYQSEKEPFFQRKVYYDNLPEEALPLIKKLIASRSQALMEEVNRLMAEYDRDANPNSQGTGRKAAGLGIFYFEDDSQEK
ncbi:MAG: DUF6502 family protein [Gammaproteobacteria bacterium]|nr:DUF6502 family protein [Gammaproteobacteria bacterium]